MEEREGVREEVGEGGTYIPQEPSMERSLQEIC